ncbi:MAG: DUF2812 domain-containing protein [Vagococcus sp.]|uniref:DUF2812 domain-containing protein n=1 Tax=Vagococcus sp. TaxID=1933889 RepID=UPI002FCC5741
MIIGDKKFIMSKGLAFYAELESERLEKELSKGWEIESINWLGYYRLKKVEPENSQVVIDFYPGNKKDVDEYIDFYEMADWKKVTSYRKRYYVFKAKKGNESVYTDEESFAFRVKKEQSWFLMNGIFVFLLGLLFISIIHQPAIKEILSSHFFIFILLNFVGMVGVLFPVSMIITMIYFKLTYGKRTTYFNHPEKYAKKQRFLRDLFLLMLSGFVVGVILSFIYHVFN